MLTLEILPTLSDNYTYLLWTQDGSACLVDPGEAAQALAALDRHGLRLRWILHTHHHADHTGGNRELHARTGAEILGPGPRIPGLQRRLTPGETIPLGAFTLQVIPTPGHTCDSVCYYFPGTPGRLFTGDTLFIGGCGRLFEGTPADLWDAFQRLRALPPETLVYVGHEYTLENFRFACAQAPENRTLRERFLALQARLAETGTTLPTTLAEEMRTNLFFSAPDPARLGALRELKNRF